METSSNNVGGIIVRISVMMLLSLILPTNVEQLPKQRFTYKFPFVFSWASPDLLTVIPLIIAAIVLSIIMVLQN